MKKLFTFLVFAFVLAFASSLSAQTPTKDVVYLKNGSVVRGVITEINPNVNLKISTPDGNLFVFEMKDVEKIIKEEITKQERSQHQENQIINNPNFISTTASQYREPVVATLCSFLIPGLGQAYNGQSNKARSHMVWYIASYGLMYFSFSQMTYVDSYGDAYLTENAEAWALSGLAASVSALTCWIVSMVDANKTSRKINYQLGFANIKLGENSNLSFNPEIKLVNDYSSMTPKTISPSYGLNMRISF